MAHRSVCRSIPDLDQPNSRRHQSASGDRPSMSLWASTKPDLNLVLCGSGADLKASVSKSFRGEKPLSPSHQIESSLECVLEEEKIHGRLISLVELPALSRLSEEEVMRKTLNCVSLCHPGVHAFLIIVPDAPLTDEVKAEIEKIHRIFASRGHLIFLLITDPSVEEYESINSSPESQRLISLYGGQYRLMRLKEPEDTRQIPDLLDYIENMNTEPYSLQMYVKAQENRVRDELEEEHQKELKRMKKEIKELQQKMYSEGAESEDLKCLRIVLIGRTGSGKSATGNTILGRDEFESRMITDSVSSVCQRAVGEVDGRSVAVVDTPGLVDMTLTNKQTVEEIVKCVSLSSPGPHVFVIVLSVKRFNQVDMDTVDLIKKIFGDKAVQFSIVLFTRGDELENTSIQQHVERSESEDLKKLIRDCGNRFLVFDNREKQNRSQVIQLLNMIEEVKNINKGRYFTNRMFEEAEMSIKKRMNEILKEREREIQAQYQKVRVKYEREMEELKKRLEEEKRNAFEERIQRENEFKQKEEKLLKDLEEKHKKDQKTREVDNNKLLKEERQQKAEYLRKIEEMKREMKNQRSQHEKQRKEREEEDRKREEKYRQEQEKMKHEHERIVAELQMRQEEEIKRRGLDEKRRNEEEEEERRRWIRKIKEAENDRREIQEEIKRQQREWEEEERKRKERHEEQLREKQEELEKMRERFERERDGRQMIEEQRQKQRRERQEKERHEEQLREKQEELEKMKRRFEREREERQKVEKDKQKEKSKREEKERKYEDKKTEMKRLERERKEEWERRKQDEERQEEERKSWKKMIEDLKREHKNEVKRREREEEQQDEIKQKHEEEIKEMEKKFQYEARKQAEEFKASTERKLHHVLELDEMIKEHQKQQELLEKLYKHLKEQKGEEIKELQQEVEKLKTKSGCIIQ